ncbi:MAG: redoxin domain-containing protein, partial [Planctomycetaceae bacterium]|nr:redoxin domain-containing protein [Planctomycetaceae bacterium]
WQQEASARVDHAHMIRDRVLPDQIHNFAHNNEWFIRNLLYTGRIHDAVDLAKNMTELPRHPKYNTIGKRGSSAYYGRMRLFIALNQNEMWPEMIELCNSAYLEPTDDESEQIKRLRHLGRAYFRNGNLDHAQTIVQEVKDWQAKLDKKKLDAQIKAENEVIAKAKKTTKQKPGQSDEDYERDLSRKSAKDLKKAQDQAAKPFATTLRALEKTLEEFEGQQALADGKFKEAYDLLRKAGGQDSMFMALVKLWAGDKEEAAKQATAFLPRHKNETIPLAQVAYLYWKAGKSDEAKKTFDELRKLSGPIDLDTPIFARLAPYAKELGLKADWRMPLAKADDVGVRPSLDTLGPFRWHPSQAEPWSLPDKDGNTHSLSDYQGKPVVVIFYLGFGCLHCVEQLKAFAPKAEEFKKQGIELIAISTESKESLEIALKNFNKDQEFAFPLVADPEYNIFKAYRAFDDFENLPLHGTYLIDPEGRVRWHDISYEPFMEPDFVLKEAARLFGQKKPESTLITVKTLKPTAKPQPAIAEKALRK